MTRKEVIAELLDYELESIQSDRRALNQFLADVLEYGYHGYYSMTDAELAEQYKEVFEEDITIEA